MDPVSALSLVANIFGVISFAKDVFEVASQIHKRGDSEQLLNLEQAIKTLQSAVGALNPNAPSAAPDAPDKEDEPLSQLTRDITRAVQKIASLLDDVRGGRGRSWPLKLQTALQTFKTVWNRHTTDQLSKEISDMQQRLHLYMTVSIKVKLERTATGLEDAVQELDHHTKALLSSFLKSFDELDAKCDDILTSQDELKELMTTNHREVLVSIQNMTGGSPLSGNVKQQHLSDEQIERAEDTILTSLWFRFMDDRQEMIDDAHKKTFDWIYSDPTATGQPWDDFGKFLRDPSSTIYWVSGKPGSGKSTLMKHIASHPTTKELLSHWAGQNDLVMARFFFFYAGSQLQRSEAGVLRSLLYQILTARRDLIQVAFPERYRGLRISREGQQQEWHESTVIELRRALITVVEKCTATYFFLAVDGLDEHEAGNAEMKLLVTTMEKLADHANVKAVVSSRPWTVFEDSFAGRPLLRLHDLTRPDIARFVDTEVKQHPRFQKLASESPGKTANLVGEIVHRSCGVFLWVHLVVRSIKEGLTNHDTIDDLRDRVSGLPSDLEDMYRHLWDWIPSHYRSQAARLVLLVETAYTWYRHPRGGKSTLLSLSFSEMDAPGFVFSAAIAPLKKAEITARSETMRARLSSRCMGLLQVHTLPITKNGLFDISTAHDFEVTFLHRTVHEFLGSPDVRQSIMTAAAADSVGEFIPELRLARTALMRTKTYHHRASREPDGTGPGTRYLYPFVLQDAAEDCFRWAFNLEKATGRAATRELLELDRVMRHLYVCCFQGTAQVPSQPETQHWPAPLLLGSFPEYSRGTCDFLCLCVRWQLFRFLNELFARNGPPKQASRLLTYALTPEGELWDANPDLILLLLEKGASPTDYYGHPDSGDTAWDEILRMAQDMHWTITDTARLLKGFLLHGADPTHTITVPTKPRFNVKRIKLAVPETQMTAQDIWEERRKRCDSKASAEDARCLKETAEFLQEATTKRRLLRLDEESVGATRDQKGETTNSQLSEQGTNDDISGDQEPNGSGEGTDELLGSRGKRVDLAPPRAGVPSDPAAPSQTPGQSDPKLTPELPELRTPERRAECHDLGTAASATLPAASSGVETRLSNSQRDSEKEHWETTSAKGCEVVETQEQRTTGQAGFEDSKTGNKRRQGLRTLRALLCCLDG